MFFVLSGLTVAASCARSRNFVDFIVARALRIFPGLMVCTIVVVASGLQSFSTGCQRSRWTLKFEFLCYLLLAAMASMRI